MVCDVAFLQWTKSGELRHPIFHAFREDKPARAVTREEVVDDGVESNEAEQNNKSRSSGRAAPRGATLVCGCKISDADRVVDASAGHTKLEVVRYYEAIEEWSLPCLHSRPLTLVRARRDLRRAVLPETRRELQDSGVEELPTELHPDHPRLMIANTQKALIGPSQMGVLELHTEMADAADRNRPHIRRWGFQATNDLSSCFGHRRPAAKKASPDRQSTINGA